jgi:SAM-dependent methyltransferase
MSPTSVSIVVPVIGEPPDRASFHEVERYLESTGLTYEILPISEGSYGAALRRGVSEAKGDVIVIADDVQSYPPAAIGDAVAAIQSGATEIVFAVREHHRGDWLARTFLTSNAPDPIVRLNAFTSGAAKLLVGESKLTSSACDLEIAFLANKYGFRIERLHVRPHRPSRAAGGFLQTLGAVIAVRLRDRNNAYRAARRCPVCFSSEVWTRGQIPGNVIRLCYRCKCRFLNQFPDPAATAEPVRRVLAAHPPATEPGEDTHHSRTARERTSARRLAAIRRHVSPRARILEVGIRDGSFGVAAAREYEYVGIDRASSAVRSARGKGLEVYCATLSSFVNTGPAFDATVLFQVLENMADPHDALSRIKDLLKPGGFLLLTTFDTEGILYLMTEERRMAQNFRTHVILYSRSALIELLERSGFEIMTIGPEFEYRDHRFLRHWVMGRWPALFGFTRLALRILPDPMLIGSGSIRIIARRRSGAPVNVRAIRAVEPTHAR